METLNSYDSPWVCRMSQQQTTATSRWRCAARRHQGLQRTSRLLLRARVASMLQSAWLLEQNQADGYPTAPAQTLARLGQEETEELGVAAES